MEKKLIVISIDSMIEDDLEILKGLPNFAEVLNSSSVVRKMESTYPTLTHSIHTSILTGCYPLHHGVINNELFMPGIPKAPWYEESELVKVKTLPEQAKAYGYKTAYIFWPLTMHADMPWVLHRASIHTPSEHEQDIIRQRSTPGLLDEVAPAVEPCWSLPHHQASDLFCTRSAEYLLERYQPDITYIHLVLIDHTRHTYGVYSSEIARSYQFLDAEVGRILSALKRAGTYDQTILCFTSDHGHLDVDRAISLNRFFCDHGLCDIAPDGSLLSWKAYAHSCALSSQIYVKDHDPEVREQVLRLLTEHREALGIREIFTEAETEAQYCTGGDYDFMVDTDGHTCFSYDLRWPLETSVDNSDYRSSRASHGHLPFKGPQPCFFVRNPFTGKKVQLEQGRIVDQAPTLAKMLDFELKDCDGRPIDALL